jgi:predicted O-methyltransferase YrrM
MYTIKEDILEDIIEDIIEDETSANNQLIIRQEDALDKQNNKQNNKQNDKQTNKTNYIFTVDRFSYNIQIWTYYLKVFKNKPNLRFLEIGSFQGRSTIWLLENILTNDTSTITCIDTFEGSVNHIFHFKNDIKNVFDIFSYNISKFKNKVNIIKDKSQTALKQINEQYDFIYIDGDHKASSVIEDAILSFPLLKKGGIIIFDNYMLFGMKKLVDNPKPAIDVFLEIYANKINVLYKNHQVIIKKL